jgi:2-methylisocitrate lyase-like PEP mutase family enzyme
MHQMTLDFRQLHQSGTFVLVNVHDAGSAVVAQSAGAVALGTTSSGYAWSIGRPDAAGAVSRDEVARHVATICRVVDIPVSVDAENGWAHEPEGVAESIRVLAEAGASGASIEDWSGDVARGYYDRSLATERVQAAVEAARSLPRPFVICARAEAFVHGAPDPLDEALARLQSFAAVGAECLYAPGPTDRATLARIVAEAGGPVNTLIHVGSALTLADAAEIGSRRVSIGGSLYRATLTLVRDFVQQVLTTGSFATGHALLTGPAIEGLLPKPGER